ncbi:ABC transporter transmembrane domain-containing protein [Pseudohongiella sp.]|uniref:ABC transmembrane type-1 domain-containing protein n=1 Tax=marine sediment metagenome TaxID=412755 RepID=A0A0F9W7P7_9ZZZZ|nr:ABC transporter transmembrane domain-containing protein [Pseudohongiella sp.]HDZ07528.1 ATP-binding cassette domain-containing protein [Pseudohongiella sp.]HEA62967.1 ATP-binding cassette domain-containing protein [Pseudohongiella sp.]
MNIFLKLGWYFRAEWRRYAVAGLLLVAVDVMELMIPWLVGQLIDDVLAQRLQPESLWRYVLIIAALAVVIYVMRFFWRMYLFSASFQLAELLRQRVFKQLTTMAPAFYNRHRTGDLMARATNDVTAVEMTAGEGVLSGLDGLVTGVLVLFVMLMFINWQLTLVALLPFPFMAWFFYVIGNRLHDGFRDAQERFSDLNDRVQESVSGIRMIRAFGREAREDEVFLSVADRAAEANMRVATTDSLYDPAIFLTVGASFMLSIGMGAWLVTRGEITLGELTSFTMYLGFLIWPMFAYGWLLNLVERGNAAYTRISALLDARSPVEDSGTEQQAPSFDVSWRIGRFCYPGSDNAALANVDLLARQGQTLGIVGATGAGKTSLINLLLRYYDDPACEVGVGGIPVSGYELHALRDLVAVVPQDAFLFTATIAENIALGKPGATLDEIRAVARLAAVEQDILRFPAAYETLVGERGVTLSGGQKQRIAIARALLLDAPILILDDALSAVDVGTERSILAHLREARQGRTTLILCHRLSAVEDADQIAVLSHGELAELGTHRELLARQGWYARMFDYQQLERAVVSGR